MQEQIADLVAALEGDVPDRSGVDALRRELEDAGDWRSLLALIEAAAVPMQMINPDFWNEARGWLLDCLRSTSDGKERADGWMKVAEISESRLDDSRGTVMAWIEAWQADPSREDACNSARQAAAREGLHLLQLRILETSIDRTDSARDRVDLLLEAAEFARQTMGDPARAERFERSAAAIEGSLDAAPTLPPMAAAQREGAGNESPTRPMEIEAATGMRRVASGSGDAPPPDEPAVLRASLINRDAAEQLATRVGALVESAPTNPRVLQVRALHLELLGKFAEAAEVLEQASRREGDPEVQEEIYEHLGRLHWIALQDLEAAEKAFRGLKVLNRKNLTMLRFFADRQEADEDWRRLFTTLMSLRDATEDPMERAELSRRLGRLAEVQLDSPEKAAEVWKGALKQDPDDSEARSQLKRLLRASGRWNALLEVLKEEVGKAGDGEVQRKVNLNLEMAAIYRDRLNLPVMVNNVYSAVLELDPGNAEAVEALAERYESTGRWNELSRILADRAEASEDDEEKAGLWRRVAEIRRDRLQNPGLAAEALSALLEVVPDDTGALDALHGIYTAQGNHAGLLRVEERRILQLPTAERVARLLDMAHRAEEELEDPATAAAFYARVLESLPDHEAAEENLERLLRAAGDGEALTRFLRGRLLRSEPFDVDCAMELAGLLDEAGQGEDAESLWREVLDHQPDHDGATSALTGRWEEQERWDDLELHARERDAVEGLIRRWVAWSGEGRETRLRRALSLVADELQSPALEREVLGALLDESGEDRELLGRLDSALERSGAEAEERLPVLQRLLDGTSDPDERHGRIVELAAFCSEVLKDPAMAWRWYAEAVESRPMDVTLRETAGKAAAEAGESAAFFQVLKKEAASQGRSPERTELHRFLGRYASSSAEQPAEAAGFYERVLEVEPDDLEALSSLQLLYREAENWEDLRRVLDLDVEAADEKTAWQSGLFAAEISLRELDDAEDALVRSGVLGERFGDRREFRQLKRDALQALGRAEEVLAELVREKSLAESDEEEHALDLELALLRLRQGVDLADALDALDSRPEPLVAARAREFREALAGVVARGDGPAAAGQALLRTARLAAEPEPLVEALDLLIGRSEDDHPNLESMLLERARTQQKLEQPLAALDGLLARASASQRYSDAFWDELESLGMSTERSGDVIDVLEDAAVSLADDELLRRRARYVVQAIPEGRERIDAWRALLDRDPFDQEALTTLVGILPGAGDDALLVDVLVRLAAQADAAEERSARLRGAAELAARSLGDPDRAIAILGNLLEESPGDMDAIDEVEALLLEQDRSEELAAFFAEQASRADDTATRVALRRSQAGVLETRMGDPGAALAIFRDLLDDAPGDPEILGHFERLAEQTGDSEAVISVLSLRAESAEGDAVAPIHSRMARLYLEEDAVDAALTSAVIALDADKTHEAAWTVLVELWPKLGDDHPRRLEAAERLERRFRDTEDHARLVEVLRVRIAERAVEGVQGWSELARLYEDNLERPDDAARAWREIVRIDPASADALEALRRLAASTGRHDSYAEALDEALEWSELSGAVRADLLERRALLAELDGRTEEAISLLDEAIDCDAGRASAASALLRSLEKKGDHERAVEVMEGLSRDSNDQEEQADWASRASRLALVRLDDRQRAAAALRAAFDRNPASDRLVGLLAVILEASEDWDGLAGIFRARMASLEGSAARVNALLELAYLQRTRLDDANGAWDSLRDALAMAPRSRPVLEEVARLHRALCRGEDALSDQVFDALAEGLSGDDQGGSRLLGDAAALHLRTLTRERVRDGAGLAERVIELASAAADHATRVALHLRLLNLGEGAARWRERALTVMESDEDHLRMSRELIDIASDASVDEAARIEAGLAVPAVLGEREEGRVLARAALQLVTELDPDNADAARALDGLVRQQADPSALAAWLEQRLESTLDPAPRSRIVRELAETRARLLSDSSGAVDLLRNHLAANPDDIESIEMLAGLFRQQDAWDDLAALLDTWISLVKDAEERRALCIELASVHADELDDVDNAALVLQIALDDAPQDYALHENLVRLFETHERTAEALDALDRLVSALPEEPGTRAPFLLRSAHLLRDQAGEPERAVRAAVDALMDGATADEVERFLAPMLAAGDVPEDLLASSLPAFEKAGNRTLTIAALEAVLRSGIDEDTTALKLAELLAEEDDTRERAFELLGQALVLRPEDEALIERLLGLGRELETLDRCMGLIEDALSSTDDVNVRKRLALRMAELALETGSGHDDVIAALAPFDPVEHDEVADVLRRLRDVPAVRAFATGRLEAVFRNDGDASGLMEALQSRLADAEGGEERAGILLELSGTASERAEAFDFACASLAESPSEGAVERAVDLAADPGETMRVVSMIEGAAEDVEDADQAVAWLRKGAALCMDVLEDVDHAAEMLVAAFDRREDAETRSLLVKAVRKGAAIEPERKARLLEQEAAEADAEDERHELLIELAMHVNEGLGDPERAASVLRAITDDQPSHEMAWTLLERFAVESDDWEQLVRLLEERAEAVDEEGMAMELLRRRISVLSDEIDDAGRVAFALRSFVDRFPDQEDAWEELEEVLLVVDDAVELQDVLVARLARTEDPRERAALLFRIGVNAQERLDDGPGAQSYFEQAAAHASLREDALVRLEELHRDREDWPALVDVLERRAEGGDASLLCSAGVLLVDRLSDFAGGARLLEACVEKLPSHVQAAAVLAHVRKEQGEEEKARDVVTAALEAGAGRDELEKALSERSTDLSGLLP